MNEKRNIEKELSDEKVNINICKKMLASFGLTFAIALPLGTFLGVIGSFMFYNLVSAAVNSFILTLVVATITLGGFSVPFIIQHKHSKNRIKKLEAELLKIKKEEKNNIIELASEKETKNNYKIDNLIKTVDKKQNNYEQIPNENKNNKQKKLILDRRNNI